MLYIFDWDGTLMDSTGKIIDAMICACDELGLPSREAGEIQNIIGLGLSEAIKVLYPSISLPMMNQLKTVYSSRYVAMGNSRNELFPSVMPTLEALRDRGDILTVATGKSRVGLNRVLDELSMKDFFHDTRCADETASKPNPRMLEELLAIFNCEPSEAMMIGDTEWDLSMAQTIDMPSVAVTYGAHTIERLKKFSPVAYIDRMDSLLNLEGELEDTQ